MRVAPPPGGVVRCSSKVAADGTVSGRDPRLVSSRTRAFDPVPRLQRRGPARQSTLSHLHAAPAGAAERSFLVSISTRAPSPIEPHRAASAELSDYWKATTHG